MAFTIGQMLGGWRKKDSAKTRKASRAAGEFSRRGRAAVETGSDIDRGGVKENSNAAREASVSKGESDLAWELIAAPHISEKATMMGDGKYTFKVSGKATKGTIKRAIEDRYKVNVEALNVLNMPSKKRRRGAMVGVKSGFKKAIVALRPGQTINEF